MKCPRIYLNRSYQLNYDRKQYSGYPYNLIDNYPIKFACDFRIGTDIDNSISLNDDNIEEIFNGNIQFVDIENNINGLVPIMLGMSVSVIDLDSAIRLHERLDKSPIGQLTEARIKSEMNRIMQKHTKLTEIIVGPVCREFDTEGTCQLAIETMYHREEAKLTLKDNLFQFRLKLEESINETYPDHIDEIMDVIFMLIKMEHTINSEANVSRTRYKKDGYDILYKHFTSMNYIEVEISDFNKFMNSTH